MTPAGSNLCVALSRTLRHGCYASWPATFRPSMRSSGTEAGSGGFRPRAGSLQLWTPWRENGLCRIRPGPPRGVRHSTRKAPTAHPQHRKISDRHIKLRTHSCTQTYTFSGSFLKVVTSYFSCLWPCACVHPGRVHECGATGFPRGSVLVLRAPLSLPRARDRRPGVLPLLPREITPWVLLS